MRGRALPAASLLYAVTVFAPPAAAQVDQQRAAEWFTRAQALCDRDGGRLWGVSICGPMVIADLRTQTIATSQPAPDSPRPRLLGIVNAPIEWGGMTWGAYMWDTVANVPPHVRDEMLIHELFHGVQMRLGLAAGGRAPEHLDGVDGRYWLRLEWRALARALRESDEGRRLAIRDALAFRQARRALYPAGVEDERAVEITEGLASYTGTVIAAASVADAIASALDRMADVETGESYVRTFAYGSGPAYGVLLDAASPGWPRRVQGTDDFGDLLIKALGVSPASDVRASATKYGGDALRAAEVQRDQQRQARIAELRRQFVDGPVLVITGGGGGMMNTMGAMVIPGSGTVYFGPFRFSTAAGVLEAEKGVLVSTDGGTRRVPAPGRKDDTTVAGDGWTFTVAPGWAIREGPRPRDYEVVRP